MLRLQIAFRKESVRLPFAVIMSGRSRVRFYIQTTELQIINYAEYPQTGDSLKQSDVNHSKWLSDDCREVQLGFNESRWSSDRLITTEFSVSLLTFQYWNYAPCIDIQVLPVLRNRVRKRKQKIFPIIGSGNQSNQSKIQLTREKVFLKFFVINKYRYLWRL